MIVLTSCATQSTPVQKSSISSSSPEIHTIVHGEDQTPIVPKLSIKDRTTLQKTIKQIRDDIDKIDTIAHDNTKEIDNDNTKKNILVVLDYASTLSREEKYILQTLDRIGGWDDTRTIKALADWETVTIGPMKTISEETTCDNIEFRGTTCILRIAYPVYQQILKIDPILRHGTERMDAYLQKSPT